MRLCAAIPHALRHRIRLGPYDVLPEIPAVSAEGEGQHPRDTDEVLVCIRIPNIQPQRAIVSQHPPHFAEHGDKTLNVLLRRGFKADLAGRAIVAQAIVGRRGHAAVDGFVRQSPQHFERITVEYSQHHHLHCFCCGSG